MNINDIQEKDDLIAYGDQFFQTSAKARKPYEQQWLLNLAFVAGDQLVDVNKTNNTIDRIDTDLDPAWKIRMVNNRILPVYRTMTAKLTKNKPIPSAKAMTGEEADIQAARGAIKLLENHWKSLGLGRKHVDMVGWLVATGNCFYKQFWNPQKGEEIVDLREAKLELGLLEDGSPRLEGELAMREGKIKLGDTDLVIRSPFNIYPEPGKTTIEEMAVFGDAQIMSADEVERVYGEKVEASSDTNLIAIDMAVDSIVSGGRVDEKKIENATIVKELYVLPCKKFPKGIMFRWCGNKLLGEPQECSELPYTHFGLIGIPGKFWSKGIVEDLIINQRRWNHLLSKMEMHNDYYNDPPIIVPPNSIDIDEWTNEPGQVLVKMAPGTEHPYVMPVPPLDQNILRELDIIDRSFEQIPVLNKVSFGQDTPNATSGRAINFLQEKDDDIVRPLIEGIEEGYAEVFRRDFKLCQANYTEDRGFAIVGDDNRTEWVEFSQANLEANIDVGVEAGSAMPRSKVAQQSMVMDMLNAGFFTDPQTGRPNFQKALKYMEFGSVDEIYEDNALDANQQRRENEKMKKGEPVEVEDWHNHEIHVQEINRMRKRAEYDEFPPEVKQLFADHVAQHLSFANPPPQQQPQPEPQQQSLGGGQPMEPPVPQGETQMQPQSGQVPPPEEIKAFLAYLQQTNPQVFEQLLAVPEEQRVAAAIQLMQQMAQAPPT